MIGGEHRCVGQDSYEIRPAGINAVQKCGSRAKKNRDKPPVNHSARGIAAACRRSLCRCFPAFFHSPDTLCVISSLSFRRTSQQRFIFITREICPTVKLLLRA
jgi:hypothetical protein